MKFRSIRLMETGENYEVYVQALTLFDYVLNGKKLTEADKDKKTYSKVHGKIIDALINDYDKVNKCNKNKDIPIFVRDLFRTFVLCKKQILIHLDALNEDYPFMKKHLSSKKCQNLILFDKITSCFQNCAKITIWCSKSTDNNMTKLYLDELREILNRINLYEKQIKISLRTIKLNDAKNRSEFVDDTFKTKMSKQFPFCKLSIDLQTRLTKQDPNHNQTLF